MYRNQPWPRIRQRSLLVGLMAAVLFLSACRGEVDSSSLEPPAESVPTTDDAAALPTLSSDPEVDGPSTTAEDSTSTSQSDQMPATTDAEPADPVGAVETTGPPVERTEPPTTLARAPTTTDEVLDEDIEFRRAAAKSPQQVLIYFGTDIDTAVATYGDLFDEISRRIVAVERSREAEELAELLAPDTYAGAFYDVVTGKVIVSVTANLSDLDELTTPAWEPYVTVTLAS